MTEDVKLLTGQDIVEIKDTRYKVIPVPEWGGAVRLRSLSAAEAIRFTEETKGPSGKNAIAKILFECAVDANGNQLFTDRQQLSKLLDKDISILDRLQNEALTLNGMLKSQVDLDAVRKTVQGLVTAGGASLEDLQKLQALLGPESLVEQAKKG